MNNHKKLISFAALVLALNLLPSANAEEKQKGYFASDGKTMSEYGFDNKGESSEKAIFAVNGKDNSGLPANNARKTPAPSSNGISYNGGAVMTDAGGIKVNLIWYGTWNDTQKSIVRTMVGGLSGSAYFNINTTYYDAAKNKIQNLVSITSEFNDNYSQGNGSTKALTDAQIWNIVANAATTSTAANSAIINPKVINLVLTSADVRKEGFLTSYCGWHNFTTAPGVAVKYGFIGNPGSNGACNAQTGSSPNGDTGIDAMSSVIAHELEEAATDPQLNAWYDGRGYENADKCSWTFGTTYKAANGSKANMKLGGKDYLIQRNWLNANGGLCTLSY